MSSSLRSGDLRLAALHYERRPAAIDRQQVARQFARLLVGHLTLRHQTAAQQIGDLGRIDPVVGNIIIVLQYPGNQFLRHVRPRG